ncbi:hypothetical protein L3Y34_012701 [Caenorhabditis briggsae]|uniref:Uncharacterized protein n=1 Tax=Caenorhabditis briggsae TaxID=6238 RepID=A0AAE8ZPX4_CAEBR|nr:hypothetical protein L3Y34_012701 [Caenorhabditis briggsae]
MWPLVARLWSPLQENHQSSYRRLACEVWSVVVGDGDSQEREDGDESILFIFQSMIQKSVYDCDANHNVTTTSAIPGMELFKNRRSRLDSRLSNKNERWSDSVFGGVPVESFSEGASEGTDSGAGEASFLESGPPEVSTDAIAGESAGFRGNDDEDSQEQENKVKRSRTAI